MSEAATRSVSRGISPGSGGHCTRQSAIWAVTYALEDFGILCRADDGPFSVPQPPWRPGPVRSWRWRSPGSVAGDQPSSNELRRVQLRRPTRPGSPLQRSSPWPSARSRPPWPASGPVPRAARWRRRRSTTGRRRAGPRPSAARRATTPPASRCSRASSESSSPAASANSPSSMADRARQRLSSGDRGVDARSAWRWSALSERQGGQHAGRRVGRVHRRHRQELPWARRRGCTELGAEEDAGSRPADSRRRRR